MTTNQAQPKPSSSKPFNENHTIKYFCTLHSNFWNGDNIITKNYNELKAKSSSNQETIKQAYKILGDQQLKEDYLTFLFYNYILSQPFSFNQLRTHFNQKIFPFYLFSVLKKGKIYILTIDFIKMRLNIQHKYKTFKTIPAEEIIFITKRDDSIYINNLPQTNIKPSISSTNSVSSLGSSSANSVVITPEIKEQLDLIYSLIFYLLKLREKIKLAQSSDKDVKESSPNTEKNSLKEVPDPDAENQKACQKYLESLDILRDDSYIPSGLILKATVLKLHLKLMGKGKRFIVLGSSQMLIFKDEMMSKLCSVIPIIPYHIIFNFNDETLTVKFILLSRSVIIMFNNIDEYTIWKSTLLDIAENKVIDKIEESCPDDLGYQRKGGNTNELTTNIDKEIDKLKASINDIKNYQNMMKSRMINVAKN